MSKECHFSTDVETKCFPKRNLQVTFFKNPRKKTVKICRGRNLKNQAVGSRLELKFKTNLTKGSSINDVSSEGEGGGPPSKPIYYISLFSNLSREGEGGGS